MNGTAAKPASVARTARRCTGDGLLMGTSRVGNGCGRQDYNEFRYVDEGPRRPQSAMNVSSTATAARTPLRRRRPYPAACAHRRRCPGADHTAPVGDENGLARAQMADGGGSVGRWAGQDVCVAGLFEP